MKKSISINLAGTIFSVDEDAYERLQAYLSSVNNIFANVEDGEEIIDDIEHRIAEHFIERDTRGGRIVGMSDVESVITVLGEPDSMADGVETAESGPANEPTSEHTAKEDARGPKRLFRDEERGIIAGVCAGIAAYTGIDVVFVRILFLALIFFNGVGVLLYIICWIAMPEAKTVAEKMQMRGEPVTIESLKTKAEEMAKSENVTKAAQNVGNGIQRGAQTVAEAVKQASNTVGPMLTRIIGALLLIIGFVGITVLGYLCVIATFGFADGDIPQKLIEGIPRNEQLFLFGSAAVVILYPLVSFISSGLAMTQNRRSRVPQWVSIPLIILWCIALFSGLTLAAKNAQTIQQNIDAFTRDAATATREVDLRETPGITTLDVSGAHTVRVLPAETGAAAAVVRGPEHAIQYTDVEADDQTLTIGRDGSFFWCFFLCLNQQTDVEVRLPSPEILQHIELSGASRVVIVTEDGKTINTLDADISGASRFTLPQATIGKLDVDMSGASQLEMSGTVVEADIDVSGSSILYAAGTEFARGSLELSGASEAFIVSAAQAVAGSIELNASGASDIWYSGNVQKQSITGASGTEELPIEEMQRKNTLNGFTRSCVEQPFATNCQTGDSSEATFQKYTNEQRTILESVTLAE